MVVLVASLSCVDYLYSVHLPFSRDPNGSLSLGVEQRTIHRSLLTCDEKGSISQFLWGDSFLCRRVDTSSVLYTDLTSLPYETRVLQNNQHKLTRAVQSILNTASRILAIASWGRCVFFLYNSMELQVFDTESKSWAATYSLPLSCLCCRFTYRPDGYASGSAIQNAVLSVLENRLVVAINSGCEFNEFILMYGLAPLRILHIIPRPRVFTVALVFSSHCRRFRIRTHSFRTPDRCPTDRGLSKFGLLLSPRVIPFSCGFCGATISGTVSGFRLLSVMTLSRILFNARTVMTLSA